MSSIIVSNNMKSNEKFILTEEEALIILEAFSWVNRRADIREKFATHADLSDEVLLPLALKVKRFLVEKGE